MVDSAPRLDRAAAMRAMAHAAAKAGSEDELLTELCWTMRWASGADGCDILLLQENSLVLRASTHAPEYNRRCRMGRTVGLSGHALTSNEPIFLRRRIQGHQKFVAYPGLDQRHVDGGAVLPLVGPKGPIGVMWIHREVPWPFTEAERKRIQELAEHLADSLGAFQNGYAVANQANRIGAVTEVSKVLATSPYLEEILQLLVNITAQQFHYRVCTVRLLDEERGELVLRATQAPAKAYAKKRAIRLGESIAGRAISENRPIIVPDVLTDPEYIGHDLAAEYGLRSMICLPLTIQSRAVGVISCYTDEVRDFLPDEVAALETIAKQAAVSIEHAKLQVRSTLLQEMHHRVKNNLQQVASLLRLQLRHGSYKSLEQALNDSLSRILAIAAVHELLSREDLDHVGMRSIAEALVAHHRDSLVLPNRRIGFLVRGDEAHLNTTQATQVALILNELVQNAIEHGFKATTDGEIHVTVEEREGEVALWVSNNGDPLPEDFDVSTKAHLGLQIVDNLSRSLGGRFKLSDILGWAVAEVRFTRTGGE